ncbi:MAG: chemotaxis protein CheC [Firmicutes bacterium]|nr:chemotaxis protein CheC [Bacillota bacterium]
MTLELTAGQLNRLRQAIDKGLVLASKGLSQMIKREVSIESPSVELVDIARAPGRLGGEAEEVVAVYLAVTGDITGHIIFFFSLGSACRLADFLLEVPPGATSELGELELSGLSEVGNLTGSFLLNSLADDTELTILPSTPHILRDMAGAVLNTVLAELSLAGEQALVVETSFRGASDQIQGMFFFLPEVDSLNVLVGSLR